MPSARTLVLLLLLQLLVLAGCAPRPAAPITVTATVAIQQLRLANGLLVVLDPDATATSALVSVRYHAGAKDDPPGRAGLALLFEHLTFTAQAGGLDRHASLERVGAVDIGAETAFDFTEFHETVPPSVLAYALWIEASRMAHPIDGVDDIEVRRELAVVNNELRASASWHRHTLASLLLAETLFGKPHPYGRIANMMRGQLEGVRAEELRTFAEIHHQPSNATLVVSGRFEVEEARRLVTRYFGPISSRPTPPRDALEAARLAKDDFATIKATVRTPEVAIGWLFPPPEQDGYDEILLAYGIMGPTLRTRLMSELRLADDVDVDVRGGHLGSMLVVSATLRPGVSPGRAVSEIERVMSLIASLGRTYEWDQFSDVRLARATAMVQALESPGLRVGRIQYDLEYAGAVRSTAGEVARVQRFHPADVGGAVQQFMVDARRAVVVLEPDPTAPPGGARR